MILKHVLSFDHIYSYFVSSISNSLTSCNRIDIIDLIRSSKINQVGKNTLGEVLGLDYTSCGVGFNPALNLLVM